MGVLGQIERCFLALQGLLRQALQVAIRGQGQIGIGDFRNQAQLRAAACLLLREVLFQRRVGEAAHATEQIQLVGRDADSGLINVAGKGLRREGLGRRQFFAREAGGSIDCRQQVGTLDPVLRARQLNIKHRYAQVAVIGERGGDDPLQMWISKKVTPANIHGAARPAVEAGPGARGR